jgi:alkanesulfonate monooxygenase
MPRVYHGTHEAMRQRAGHTAPTLPSRPELSATPRWGPDRIARAEPGNAGILAPMSYEVSWFAALCDDDYEFLGVPDGRLQSSWEHCRDIALGAEQAGYDNLLLPSGYAMGIDSIAFAAGIAPLLRRMQLLVAVRMGEMWPPQLARQLATIDQMLDGRLTINIISSGLPGQSLESAPRYRRTLEIMHIVRDLLDGKPVDFHGEFMNITVDPPRLRPVRGGCPPFYFGGLSEAAREVAAQAADVFLMWPDTLSGVGTVLDDMRARAARYGRTLRFGYRAHVIVRATEAEARAAARRLVSRLDDRTGDTIRRRSLDTSSAGTQRQNELRDIADDDGYAEPNLWTGIGRARSGAGAAIVGDPDQVLAKIRAYADLGMDAFILSGYPHAAEADLFARHVLPHLDHAPLLPR